MSRKAIKRFLEGPIAIIGESVVDDETARLAIVETEGVRCCELSVVRGDQREALTFDARVLITWRKELSDQRMLDHLWRHGFNFTPNDPDNSRPRPCPGVLAQASEADGTPVVVQIIETDKGRISEVVRGAGGDAQRIRLSVRHWNAWRNAMKRAALVAWRSGCDIPSSALITV